MMSTRQIKNIEYANIYKNIQINQAKLSQKAVAFCPAISKDKGLISCKRFLKSLDRWKFIEVLKEIRKAYGKKRIGIYMDNARIHSALDVKAWMSKNNMEAIFSAVYMPIF